MSNHAAAHTPPPALDEQTASALKLFVVLSRAMTSVEEHARRDIERHGLTLAEFAVLEVLHQKGPLLLGEVQRLILRSSGGITFLVDRLAKKGLVERRECETDRRARYAALTAAGEALIARLFPEHAERIRKAVSGLDGAEQAELTRLLKQLGLEAERQLG
jgi:MarR family 2-MHQ and catechol resistance regulon transcriptional repressor